MVPEYTVLKTLGERVKARRIELQLSQQQLAEGLATQGQISKIEKNELQPGSQLLYEVSKRLRCSMDYLFTGNENDETISAKLKIIENLLTNRNYDALVPLIEGRFFSIHLPEEQVALLWIRALIDYHQTNQSDFAFEKIQEAYQLMQNCRNIPLKIYVCNSYGYFLQERQEFEQAAAILEEALRYAKQVDNQPASLIKVFYTLAYAYVIQDQYEKSLSYAQFALEEMRTSKVYVVFSEVVHNILLCKEKLELLSESDLGLLESAKWQSEFHQNYETTLLLKKLEPRIKAALE